MGILLDWLIHPKSRGAAGTQIRQSSKLTLEPHLDLALIIATRDPDAQAWTSMS